MRIREFLFCIIGALLFLSSNFIVNAEPIQAPDNLPANCVVAYYFHGNFRCPTCRTMEQYSKEAIEENFKGEIASGKLIFKTVNVDEKENEHFINEYGLYTKSLVISKVVDDREIKHKNLTKIWEYVRNKDKFLDYVTSEIKDYLKE